MNYQETIQYLYSQLPLFTRDGISAYKANLDNTIELCKRLGNPQHQFKSVHVGGTNGKGEELTATVQYNLWANVISRAEIRWDHAFTNNHPFNAQQDNNAFTIGADAVLTF